MKGQQLHPWDLSISQAMELQSRLASQVSIEAQRSTPRYVAGVDISAPDSSGMAMGAAVVLSYPELLVVDQYVARDKVRFPYVPGLLSFRETPLIIQALERLSVDPDLIMVDGQGMAHPRRFGIACHIGLIMELPTVGCAKSRLWGNHGSLGEERGCHVPLTDGAEVIGTVLRTRDGVSPVYVSIGHKIDLETAIRYTLECSRGYRVPEPTRCAHLAAGGKLVISQVKRPEPRQPGLF